MFRAVLEFTRQLFLEKDNQFAEDSKKPTKVFLGSATFGSVSFEYPRNYSGYVIENDNQDTPIDGYFHPDIVPGTGNASTSYALRLRVVSVSYDGVLKNFDQYVQTGKSKVSPFRAAKVPQSLGSLRGGGLAF